MDSGNSKTSDSQRLLLKLTGRINLKREVMNILFY